MLVFPGGSEIGLEIHKALAPCKEVRLFSAGQDIPNHAPFVFRHHARVPSIREPGWVEALQVVLRQWEIDYVFPAYDDIIVALVENADRLEARVVSSPLPTCRTTRSKSETYRLLDGVVPVPRLFASAEDVAADDYPVFVKPDRGQGSQDTHLVRNRKRLHLLLQERDDYIVLEHLPGEEFTVDCFSDRDRGLLFCAGRRRTRIKSGIAMSSVTVEDPAFAEFARAIATRLTLHGAWFFQVKRDREGCLRLMEIAPRIAGTMALHRVQGVNFPLLSLYEQERVPITISPTPVGEVEIDRALTNRYRHNISYSAVYVDLDDTLLLRGKVNLDLVRFLYQCVNEGKRLVLLTRHAYDVRETLARHRLIGLFDEVIHCDQAACKADHITERDAILIDDSFRERREVREARGILTFDQSMIELLMDERH